MTSPSVTKHEVQINHKGHKVHKEDVELNGSYEKVAECPDF